MSDFYDLSSIGEEIQKIYMCVQFFFVRLQALFAWNRKEDSSSPSPTDQPTDVTHSGGCSSDERRLSFLVGLW